MTKKLSRKDVINKINALLNMTVERGASENEALKAAKHVAALLDEYDLTLTDVTETPENTGKADVFAFRSDLARFMHALAEAIGELCAVQVLIYGPGKGMIHIIGSPVDVDFARYLSAICLRVMEDQAEKTSREYALMRLNVRRRHVESVLQGMAHRLSGRILELAWARRSAMSNAVVVSKEDIIANTIRDLGIKVKLIPLRERGVDLETYKIGVERANEIKLNNAIGAGTKIFPTPIEYDESPLDGRD